MDPIAVDQDYWIEEDSDLDISPQSSDNEFNQSAGNLTESDIENEVNKTMETIVSLAQASPGMNCKLPQPAPLPPVCDGDFLSSDSDTESTSVFQNAVKRASKQVPDANEDTLYDPNMDEKDQDWVDARRSCNQRVMEKRRKGPQANVRKPATSDAILSCPACMTMLCIDCQRHDVYTTQYRAMFVMNCCMATDEALRYEIPQQMDKKKTRKRKHARKQDGKLVKMEQSTATPELSTDTYYPVRCSECNTEVAVCDQDDVYHFYNILASQA